MLKKTFIIATLFQARCFLVSNTEECGFLLKLMKRDEISGMKIKAQDIWNTENRVLKTL